MEASPAYSLFLSVWFSFPDVVGALPPAIAVSFVNAVLAF
jgi:hypothetical protein